MADKKRRKRNKKKSQQDDTRKKAEKIDVIDLFCSPIVKKSHLNGTKLNKKRFISHLDASKKRIRAPEGAKYETLIHMAKEDMIANNISIGEDIVIFDEDNLALAVGSAWPAALKSQTLHISPLPSFVESCKVIVERCIQYGVAGELTLTSSSKEIASMMDSKWVQTHLKHLLVGQSVFVGAELRLPMSGIWHSFFVENIDSTKILTETDLRVFSVGKETVLSLKYDVESENVEDEIEICKAMSNLAITPSHKTIGGLDTQLETVNEVIHLCLHKPELFASVGLKPPKGVLLYGPPGTGKTLLARSVARDCGAKLFIINGAELLGKFVGESEERLRDVFERAAKDAPSLVFIDEVDTLCPQRSSASELERRVVATLLTSLDGLVSRGRVAVLAATNSPNNIDPALRRPGRLDREVEIGIPSATARKDIIRVMLTNISHSFSEKVIDNFGKVTHGFVGADLANVLNEAGLLAIRRQFLTLSDVPEVNQLQLTEPDLIGALRLVKPSALREVTVEVPKVNWKDIGGQKGTKQELREAVEWPLQHPEAFIRMGIRPLCGVLLYGPPGCSKTLLAKALATESGMNFIAVKGPELFSKWVGESEKAVQETFRKARNAAPTVVFFDEIDALATARGGASGGSGGVGDRVLSQLLTELDGVSEMNQVVVVAATNRPDLLDPAMLRPGRIDRLVYVPPPDIEARLEIFKIHTRKTKLAPDIDWEELLVSSDGFSGAEIASCCRESIFLALSQNDSASSVKHEHLMGAINTTKPQITAKMLSFYESFKIENKK